MEIKRTHNKYLQPKLNFLKNSSNWTVKLLKDFESENGKVIKAGPFGSALKKEDHVPEGYKVYGQEQVISGDAFFGNYFISEKKFNELKSCQISPGDLLMSLVGTFGKVLLIPEDAISGIINPRLIKISISRGQIEPLFLKHYLETQKITNLLIARSQGGTMGILNADIIGTIPIIYPSLYEQQKIASFLSAVDEKIQQLTRKKELLEQYKKGVMQRLFLSELGFEGLEDDRIPEDETNPKILSSNKSQFRPLRFKDENGKDYPKWEEKLYGDIFSFYSTNSYSRDNLNYQQGSVKNIHYGDIHTKFSSLFNINKEKVPFINPEIDISKIKEENFCQEGDLVIADASEDYADIGKTIELVKLDGEKVVAGLHTFLARPNRFKMHIGFSAYLVKAEYVRRQIMTIAQGTKVLSLSPGRLGKVKLNIPSLKEQEKITKYLSAIDTKIESVTNQITQTQTFKKGLLQQMFV